MIRIRKTLLPAVAVLLFAWANAAGQPSGTPICDAAKIPADRAVACRVIERERTVVDNLKAAAGGVEHCALTRTGARLDRILSDVVTGTGTISVGFTLGTIDATGQRSELFPGAPDAVVIELLEDGATAPSSACLASEHRSVLLSVAGAVSAAVGSYNQPLLEAGAEGLRKLADTWSWIITDGFGQYPWERAFNDLVHRKPNVSLIADLPSLEWVLLHPSVGLTVSGVSALRESRGQTAFLLEPFGFTRYRFDVLEEKRSYWGASSLVVVTEGLPPAVGGLLRLNQYSFGVVRHLGGNDGVDGQWAVTATVELLERLQPARKKIKDAAKEAVARSPGR